MGICPTSPEKAQANGYLIQPRNTAKKRIKRSLHSSYDANQSSLDLGVKRKLSDGAINILQKYQVIELIGTGSFGKVLYAKSRIVPDMRVAIKCIPKKKLKNKLHVVKKEIDILRHLDHPNIVKYYQYFETSKNFFIVTEYCDGGQLFQKIASKGEDNFTEHQAGRIIEKILLAINHCHANHIAHRDLKPENILFSSESPDSELKIIDFGLSKSSLSQDAVRDGENQQELGEQQNQNDGQLNSYNHDLVFQSVVGTPYYVAPQVIKSSLKYGTKCDLWSIGVILYILLSGYIPFTGKNATQVFIKIRYGRYSMQQKEWNCVSEQAKDLVKCLLDINPKSRLSASDSLNHPWLR